MPSDARIARAISAAAAILTAAAVFLPSTVYVLLSYNRIAGSVEAEAEINARSISQIVGANPDLWRFERLRMSEILSQRPRRGYAERRRVLDLGGAVVAESADPLPAPTMTRSVPLFDAGTQVGSIEISRSLRSLVFRSTLLACALLAAGLLSFRTVRTLPIEAIRRSEEALRRQRDTVQAYLDVAGVAFVVVDGSGRVGLVNGKGAEILDRPDAQVLGKHWIEAFVEPADRARVASEMASPRRPGDIVQSEYAVVRPSGERRIVQWYVTPLADGDQDGSLLASGVDVTEQRELEQQLARAQKLEAIGRVAGGVAHDFNNVLSVIKGYAVLLRRQIPADNPQRRYVDGILTSTDRAASLTRSLLTVGQRQVLHREPVDLAQVVQRSERLLRRLIPADVEIRIDVPHEPLPVLVDSLQVERVLMNLVTNARDAMSRGGVIVIGASREVLDEDGAGRVGVKVPGSYARLSVTDSGTGMDPETQTHIFEPFFTTKEVGKGTGLGLSIAYAIVKQHQGAICVDSQPGRGTTFTLLLPLLGAGMTLPREPDRVPLPVGGETVLVAEDDGDTRSMLRQVLEGAGYAVVEAVDGNDAVRQFAENRAKVRLVLLDEMMPGQDGKPALDEIRKLEPAMRAVLLSGNGDAESATVLADPGEDPVFRKPAHPSELLRTIRKVLDA